jgi:U3 small nucleolar RNA-associated protein 10
MKKPIPKALDDSWLELSQAHGGCQAASVLLNAIDFAGEESFPLHSRWKLAGQPLVEVILKANPVEGKVPASFHSLMDTVVRMLKGVTISDPQIIISSGPRSGGGRARSYSFGKVDGVRCIEPYPKEMYNTIIDVLTLKHDTSGTRTFAALIARDVLGSKSWGDGIYKNLSRPVRKRVASAILSYFSGDVADPPDGVFVALPFDSIDISELLVQGETGARDLASVSILTDFIRSNIERLQSSAGLNGLVSKLFDLLASLSSEKSDDLDGLDFSCQSILHALRQIWDGVNGSTTEIKVEKKRLAELVSLLLALLSRSDDGKFQSVRPLPTHRSRCTALCLLASICQSYPERVVGSLLPAILTCTSTFDGPDSAAMNMSDAFAILVPVYCLHAPLAGLSLANLLSSFVGAVRMLPDERIRASAFQAVIHALGVEQESAAGAVVAAFLASEVFAMGNEIKAGESVLSAVQILSCCPASMQAPSLLLLLRYAKTYLLELQGEASETETEDGFPTHKDIVMIAMSGPSADSKNPKSAFDKPSREVVIALAQSILKTFSETLLLDSIRRFVRKSEGNASSVCLQLWQGLLVLQSTANSMTNDDAASDEAILWKSVADTVNESREYLQELLPAHIFLASVTSLIKEGGTDEIRARALRLVADRAAELDPQSPEAALFVDLIPDMVDLLEPLSAEMSEEYESSGIVLQQSALIAIEHIARGVGFSKPTGGRSTAASYFFKALERSGALLLGHYQRVKECSSDFSSLDNTLCQLFCSIALCAATLIRATGARCLPVLPKMMGIFVDLLSSTNSYVSSSPAESDSLSQARVMQLSLLRFFLAVAESVPQFLGSYLDSLLVELAVLSKCLSIVPKEHGDVSLKSAAAHLEGVLPSRIPSRLFLPAASRAVAKCSTPVEARTLLSMMKVSVEESTPAEVTAQKNIILQSVTKAYDFEGSFSERSMLLETANTVLVTLILKLSEVQLSGLYLSLREWRGDFDKTNPEKLAKRRYAFWTVSAALSKELRSIFLPCFSMVTSDAIAELELAASSLCQPKLAEKLAGGNKKRRLAASDEDAGYGIESLRTLEPLLRCLEHCLRADAHDGGNWVRSDENQRYNAILEPMGKLLQCRVPPDAPTPEGTTSNPFQRIVHGDVEDGGSVVSCLTALAAAAGNEQLWKPLNHSVLDACGNESRSEVRQAGMACLLSLMKSLGEEYMVLLPECLPVLSELLEDSDETIAALAKESVTLAEELIGESLEESLR